MMERQYSKKALVFSAVGSLVVGLVVGGLLTRAFFLPASPSVALDISAQLKEAHALLDKNLLADAERSYRAILGTDPGNTEAVSHLGNVAFQQGDIERAVRFYDMALQQDPSYAHALWDKGIALRAKGDNAGAIKAWEAFAQLFPPDSSDVVQVKKWIAEAQAQVDSAATSPEGRLKKLFENPPEAVLKEKPSN
jgi:cytochrome c-type biogenesis protein CcmH/NrfG